jgi:hypothetical protein
LVQPKTIILGLEGEAQCQELVNALQLELLVVKGERGELKDADGALVQKLAEAPSFVSAIAAIDAKEKEREKEKEKEREREIKMLDGSVVGGGGDGGGSGGGSSPGGAADSRDGARKGSSMRSIDEFNFAESAANADAVVNKVQPSAIAEAQEVLAQRGEKIAEMSGKTSKLAEAAKAYAMKASEPGDQ